MSATDQFNAGLAAAVSDHRAGRLPAAISAYESLLRRTPDNADVLQLLGTALAQLGRCEEAVRFLARSAELAPDRPNVLLNLAQALHTLGRQEEALRACDRALALQPDLVLARHYRAVTRYLLGRYAEALTDYETLAAQGKESAADQLGRGATLVALHRYGEALAPLERAVAALPGELEAHFQYGVALLNLRRYAEAVASFDRALAIRPDVAQVLNNRGIALTELGNLSAALENFTRCGALDGAAADTHLNLGIVLKLLGRPREAAASLRRALSLRPDDPAARFALGFVHLALGEFEPGWPLYEARFSVPAHGNPPRRIAAPRWPAGVSLTGKTLLVHAEQGLGDVIHFCRYLPLLSAQGARVVFEVMPSLVALMRTLAGDIRILARGEPLPQVDYFCPLLSLPLAFGTRLPTIPAQIPYLAAEPQRVASWRERLEALPGLRVGIAWQGNPTVEQKLIWARGRSMPLTALEPLTRVPGVTLVSLQKGPGAEQLRSAAFAGRIIDLGAELDLCADAFVDTAALMCSLDLVISSDTAIAHLAGALGRPVWTALPLSPEWRWLLERTDSPWYPTMRLFRQTVAGDWDSVVNEIVSVLRPTATGNA